MWNMNKNTISQKTSKWDIKWVLLAVTVIINVLNVCECTEYNKEEIRQIMDEKFITCGSTVRISHIATHFKLHSHQLTWGGGSQLQSVTAIMPDQDPNSLWILKEGSEDSPCKTGEKIECNRIIRLEHMATKQNLHSAGAKYKGMLSQKQELSCHKGGDVKDDWILECESQPTPYLKGSTMFSLKHVVTGVYVATDRTVTFTQQNCHNCPIHGQKEAYAWHKRNRDALWEIEGGVIYEVEDFDEVNSNSDPEKVEDNPDEYNYDKFFEDYQEDDANPGKPTDFEDDLQQVEQLNQ